MKAFNTLSIAEVLSLDDSDVARYLAHALAEAGIPLAQDKDSDPKPMKPVVAKTDVAFMVGDLLFTKRADALAVRKTANKKPRYTTQYVSGPGWEQLLTSATDPVEIVEKSHFTQGEWDIAKPLLEAYEEKLKLWQARKDANDTTNDARQEVNDSILKTVQAVREVEETKQRWKLELNRYVDLGLSVETARDALLLAHPEAGEYLPEIVQEDLPLKGNAMEASA